MPPLFSVILPTYNRARMARTAIKTVLYQTLRDWECWVIDDGSTDDTPEILAAFKDDSRIRILGNSRNLGMNASRNAAIEKAAGRFVTFLDSDDLWLPRRLEAFQERIAAAPQAGFIFSNAWVWRYGRILGTLFDPRREVPEGRVPGHYAVGDRHLPYVTTNVAILREAFGRWGSFKTEMRTLDTELFARFLAGGLEVAAIREPLSVRRVHGGQLTDRHAENFRESMQALKASGAPAEAAERIRGEVCLEVASYLVKAGRPGEARSFLMKELGQPAKSTLVYALSFLPPPLLASGRELRRAWLMLRHHPLAAPMEVREVYRAIEPLLSEES